uniref:hypothetical protein n=1 Tax=Aliarcobacter sp. TaxID=2321116 RepID=UPI00404712F1
MENQEISLKRMYRLLNKIDNESELTFVNDNKYSECLQKMMDYKGYSLGYTGFSSKFKNTLENLKKQLNEAKRVYLKFFVNENIEALVIGDAFKELNSYMSDNVDLLIETDIDNTLSPKSYKFQILITGLSSTILKKDFHKT